MSNFWRFLRLLALGSWLGAILYFVAVVTRGAFAVLPNRDQAGLMVGFGLSGLHVMGLVAAAVFLLASLALGTSLRAAIEPAAVGVILMAALTAASQYQVLPRMDALRRQMGFVDRTLPTDPRRAEFDRWHRASADLEGAVLLIGVVALYFASREAPRS
jgi:Domain of unknown function (DUF4149)